MAGIFRTNPASSTPAKRTGGSLFGVNFGQDVSVDSSSCSFETRSPSFSGIANQVSSPRGRSVREIEEQMASLKKENFNLKLRIYFLEELFPPGSSTTTITQQAHENFLKQNIDLKIDMELLRKELGEKQSLLCEAARAMELMENEQKDCQRKSDDVIEELTKKIEQLEKNDAKDGGNSFLGNFREITFSDIDAQQKISELQDRIKDHLTDIEDMTHKNEELMKTLTEKDAKTNDLAERIKQLVYENAELREKLSETANDKLILESLNQFKQETVTSQSKELEEYVQQNKTLRDNINELRTEIGKLINHKDEQNQKIAEQKQTIENINNSMPSEMAKKLEAFKITIDQLTATLKKMERENQILKDIIVKLELSRSKCVVVDTLQKRSAPGHLGFPTGYRETPQMSAVGNPLFLNRSLSKEKANSKREHLAGLKLKQTLSVCLDNKNEGPVGSIPFRDASFYINETKNYHSPVQKPNSVAEKDMLKSSQGSNSHSIPIETLKRTFSLNLHHAMHDFNQQEDTELNKYIRNNIRSELIPIPPQRVSTSLSDCSLTSGSSNKLSENNIPVKCDNESLLQDKPENNSKYPQLKEELNVSKTKLIEKTNLLAEVEAKFRDKVVAYESACETIQKLLVNMKNLQTEMDKIKEKHSPLRLEKVKQEIIEITPETTEHNDDQLIDVLKIKIAQIIEEKNMNIHKLESELENSASFFENFINQTLWDKNCEIEKLSKILGQSSSSPIKEFILRQSFTEMDYNEIVEYYKHQQRKIDNLFDQLYDTQEGQSMAVIEQLQIELQEARDELNSANVWRAECTEICARLTSRLNELAGFLDSLLKHKDVLGALAADKTRALRKAIDKSLDLSRSWNSMSSTLNNTTSFGDRTLNQLCSLTGMFDRSDANKENEQMFAYDSSNSNQIHVIEKLKSEIKTLKRELGRKRSADSNKKERRSITTYVDNQSESETWSEPDRNVSLARIGLEELNSAKSARRNKTETEMTSSDSASSLNRKSKSRIIEKYSQLEALLTQHENQILQIQCELVEADNRLKTETFKVSELTEELDQYKRVNEMLETEIANLKFMKHDAGYDTDSAIDQLTEERDKLTAKLHLKEMQLEGLREEMKVLKEDNDARIDEIRDEEAQKRRRLEVELESDYREKLKEQERRHHEKLSKDWVTRIMYDQTTHELTQLRHKLYDADLTIEILRENEQEFNEQMMENEKSMRTLKRSLDSAALQASKAVLERTKALSEKFSLEQRVKEITEKLNKVEKDKSDLLNKLEKLNYRTSCLGCNIFKKQSSNGSDISGYTSEDVPGCRSVLPRFDNLSPDLGIESDAGRTSSVENTLLKTTSLLRAVEISKNNTLREVAKGLTKLSHETDALNNNGKEMIHDCEKVEQENDDLKKKLIRTKRALEDTWSKLRTANQRKEQVERDIRQQILKTQTVLKNVRTNMENEMEQHKVEC